MVSENTSLLAGGAGSVNGPGALDLGSSSKPRSLCQKIGIPLASLSDVGPQLKVLLRSPLAATIGYLVVCLYIDTTTQAFVQIRADKHAKTLPAECRNDTLPDIGFDIFPLSTKGVEQHWADICVAISAALTGIRFLATIRMRWTIIRRWLFTLATLFLFRAFTIISTMLPNPVNNKCVNTAHGNPFLSGLMILLVQEQTCADVLYSGHTVNLTLCALVWHTYSHVTPLVNVYPLRKLCCGLSLTSKNRWDLEHQTLAKLGMWALTITGYIMILVTRFHYTADVWIGGLLTVFIWKMYHHYIRTAHERRNPLNRLLQWLEKGADDLQPGSEPGIPTIWKPAYGDAGGPEGMGETGVRAGAGTGAGATQQKLIIVVRSDVGMEAGQLAAQCSRAVLGAYQEMTQRQRRGSQVAMRVPYEYGGESDSVLRVNDLYEMEMLQSEARDAGLPVYALPEVGTIAPAVVAIGPAACTTIDNVSGHLELL